MSYNRHYENRVSKLSFVFGSGENFSGGLLDGRAAILRVFAGWRFFIAKKERKAWGRFSRY
jgi:hypothetical protein